MRKIINSIFTALILASIPFTSQTQPYDFEIIKERIVTELMKSSVDDLSVEETTGRKMKAEVSGI